MIPHYSDDRVTLYAGDCLDVLATLPDASVDAVVTDPPYGLEFMGKDWDAPWKSAGDVVADPASVGGFQDGSGGNPFSRARIRYGREGAASRGFGEWCEQWSRECLRVLKPGGHMLAFGGTRTWHRLATAVEDAGFEIRDSIAWMYGSGFPKSLDVSKAIDKIAHVNDETHRRIALVAEVIRTHREAKGLERAAVSEAVVGTRSGACWNWEHQQLPSVEMWPAIKRVLDIPDEFDGLIQGTREMFIGAERAVIGQRTTGIGTGRGSVAYIADSDNRDVTAPATDDARTWQGWGTALKPAFEPIVVARKPLAGTVAGNVLAHGTGALNIDAARIWIDNSTGKGRWPANVVLDEHAAAELDVQSGVQRDGVVGGERTFAGWEKSGDLKYSGQTYGGEGGASRFFKVADRSTCGPCKGGQHQSCDGRSMWLCECPCGGGDGTGIPFHYTAKADASERPRVAGVAHPTVKPLSLMRWLVRLVTPPGGVVLEPFAGSGTTVEACLLERFKCVAIEREADYLPLIEARIHRRIDPVKAVQHQGEDLGLFGLFNEGATP